MRTPVGIAPRMVLATVTVALIVGAVFVTLLLTVEDALDAQRSAGHSQDVLIAANGLELRVLDVETGQRGFILTRQDQFLVQWQQAQAMLPEEGQALVKLVAGDAAQEARAREIFARARAYLDEYSVPLINATRQGDPSARTIAATAEGEARIKSIRADFAELLDAERHTSAATAQASTDAAHRAYAVAVVGVVMSIALVALYAGYLTRAIVRPIRRAALLTGRLAGGDLAARLDENGVGEIGTLQRSFNVMGASLEQSQAELTASRARIVVTADETRRRFGRDLHDGAQQRFVAVSMQMRAARAAVPPDLPELAAELDHAVAEMNRAIDELRDFARGIHPAILAVGGLAPALGALVRNSAVHADLDLRMSGRLPEPVEVAAYYVVSEALTNAAKHAHATSVTVEVRADDDALRVAVCDDGDGGARFGRGSGLVGLKDRVEALGGRIALESEPAAGTSLSIELPLTNGRGDAL